MSNEKSSEFLKNVTNVMISHQKEIDEDGSSFNIFSILNVASKEVRLHTKFITELLNSKGSHGFKNQFFLKFLEQLKNKLDGKLYDNRILDISSSYNYEVFADKYIKPINSDYTEGGIVDIVIEIENESKIKKRIIIENKIFAYDQKKQLLRYYNYDKKALLLYLTLDGREPGSDSTDDELINGKHFFCISYKELIISWLRECKKISNKPRINETISQYLHIIEDYTNQNKKNKMLKDIIEMIKENKDYYNAVDRINEAYDSFRLEVQKSFWETLRQMTQKNYKDNVIYSCNINDEEIKLKFSFGEDGGFYYYFFFEKKDGNKLELNDRSIIHYKNKLKDIVEGAHKKSLGYRHTNKIGKNKFLKIDKSIIHSLSNESEMCEFTSVIFSELKISIDQILTIIENDSEFFYNKESLRM
jgi:hypothetical protein